jgi:hypothetical protein
VLSSLENLDKVMFCEKCGDKLDYGCTNYRFDPASGEPTVRLHWKMCYYHARYEFYERV